MTRINLIPPSELTNKHLLAEYRELPRVFHLAKGWYRAGRTGDSLPKAYTLGKGHVRFFYDKLIFLVIRQINIVKEAKRRGFSVRFDRPEDLVVDAPLELMGVYEPTHEALSINRARIKERLSEERGTTV